MRDNNIGGIAVNKIVIISTNTDKLRKLEHAFEGLYEVKSALLTGSDILKALGGFIPDCILIYSEGIKRQDIFPIMDLKEDSRYKEIPFILLADTEDQRVFHDNVLADPDYVGSPDMKSEQLRRIVERLIAAMGRKKMILVIDDYVVALRLMKSYLEERFQVTCVKSGSMAIKFIERQVPDCILLDCFMPDMDGPQTLQKIRFMENGKTVPVIFLTGNSEKDMVMSALSLHPKGFLVKPVKKSELIQKIDESML